jgi:hypothetical protein
MRTTLVCLGFLVASVMYVHGDNTDEELFPGRETSFSIFGETANGDVDVNVETQHIDVQLHSSALETSALASFFNERQL